MASPTKIIPVILCGGSGSRLWPLSRQEVPKQFMTVYGNRSLLQETVLRSCKAARSKDFIIVLSEPLQSLARAHLKDIGFEDKYHILQEPEGRGTAAAIAYAAAYAEKHYGPEVLLWILPSDHYIGREDVLSEALKQASALAKQDEIVLFGIPPTHPEREYGYVGCGAAVPKSKDAFEVEHFKEKPSTKAVQSYINAGNYLWNSGIYLASACALKQAFLTHIKEIWHCAGETVDLLQRDQHGEAMRHYKTIEKKSFEKAVLERIENTVILRRDMDWSDLGQWKNIWDIHKKDQNGNVLRGRCVTRETHNSLIRAQNRLVACVGLENVVVVETGTAVLVGDIKQSALIKDMVGELYKNSYEETHSDYSAKPARFSHEAIIASTSEYILKHLHLVPREFYNLKLEENETIHISVINGRVRLESMIYKDGNVIHLDKAGIYTFQNISDKHSLSMLETVLFKRDI